MLFVRSEQLVRKRTFIALDGGKDSERQRKRHPANNADVNVRLALVVVLRVVVVIVVRRPNAHFRFM